MKAVFGNKEYNDQIEMFVDRFMGEITSIDTLGALYKENTHADLTPAEELFGLDMQRAAFAVMSRIASAIINDDTWMQDSGKAIRKAIKLSQRFLDERVKDLKGRSAEDEK